MLYISGFLNFDETPEMVLTVPPSRNQYYVAAYMDAYANTVGSIGTRTTPFRFATPPIFSSDPSRGMPKRRPRNIQGHEYPVMASDTTINWFVIRVLANTLIDASDPTSVPNVVERRRAQIRA